MLITSWSLTLSILPPFQLLTQEENPGVEFEYSLPKGSVAETPPEGEGYDWISGSWDECDASCGGGFRTRQIYCARTPSFDRVPDYLCEYAVRPAKNETCNTQPCKVRIREAYLIKVPSLDIPPKI